MTTPKDTVEESWEKTRDYRQAIYAANKYLDEPYLDSDGDECTISRQFLRMIERYDATEARVRREMLEKDIKEMEGKIQQLPKTKCINAENHLFGSCFQCEKIKGHNACIVDLITQKKEALQALTPKQ